MPIKIKNYYEILGVNQNASRKEIHKTFRRLALKHHPDVNPGDSRAGERFKEINEAYDVLGDPEKRKHYDELSACWRAGEDLTSAEADLDFEDIGLSFIFKLRKNR